MNVKRHLLPMMIALSALFVASAAQAGPSCDVRPNHPNCDSGGGGGGGGNDPGPIYQITFTGIKSGTADEPGVYTRPGMLNGDESSMNANSNGPNIVQIQLNDGTESSFLGVFEGDEDVCFPPTHYLSGSVQVSDNSQSGDPARVGYFWLQAYTLTSAPDKVQYAMDLFDMSGGTWSGTFPPQNIGDSISRTVTHWELRLTKKKWKDGCETGGLVEQVGGLTTVTITRVASNPWYD